MVIAEGWYRGVFILFILVSFSPFPTYRALPPFSFPMLCFACLRVFMSAGRIAGWTAFYFIYIIHIIFTLGLLYPFCSVFYFSLLTFSSFRQSTHIPTHYCYGLVVTHLFLLSFLFFISYLLDATFLFVP